ncbi:MAG: GLPGLI family protein [Chitinophagaceae bacterium]|nr:GLPGLI family protein [Chitinophagaceae bacterium]
MKKMFTAFFTIISFTAVAQQQFLGYGKIEYEFKLNIHKQMEGDWWGEEFKDKMARFKTSYFNLWFKDNKTLYQKGREPEEKVNFWDAVGFDEDLVYTDLETGTFVRKKEILQQQFLITDSIRHVEWRITNELRDIAGFTCRKAVGRLLDTIYAVAFYTDEITVSGGPISFAGLPGMILGLAIPRMGATWFATKIELTEPQPALITAPSRGKKINYKDLQETIKKGVADWGSWGKRFMWQAML